MPDISKFAGISDKTMTSVAFDLTIVLSIACTGTQLQMIIRRLVETNPKFFIDHPTELIIVDGEINPETTQALDVLQPGLTQHQIFARVVRTSVVGATHKWLVGIEAAQGEYILDLFDETIIMYDCLDAAWQAASQGYVVSLPYIEAQNPDNSLFPLAYPRYAPVAQIAFFMVKTQVLRALPKAPMKHLLGTLHYSLALWENGIPIVYLGHHLHYCPIVKMDAYRPAFYPSVTKEITNEDFRVTIDTWTNERITQVHTKMVNWYFDWFAQGAGSIVRRGDKGVYAVLYAGSLPPNYEKLTNKAQIEHECAQLLQKWQISSETLEKQYERKKTVMPQDTALPKATRKASVWQFIRRWV